MLHNRAARQGIDKRQIPGVSELESMCENARKLAALCDRILANSPTQPRDLSAFDELTDDPDEPYIWDLET